MSFSVFRRFPLGRQVGISLLCLSVCSRFLASSEKTVRAIHAQFSWCIDRLGGCVLLHFSGVHGARGRCPKMDFTRLRVRRCNEESANVMKRRTPWERTHFLWRQQCGAHRTPASAIESIPGALHQGDSYYRTSRAIDAKIGVLMVDDMAFQCISPLGVAHH